MIYLVDFLEFLVSFFGLILTSSGGWQLVSPGAWLTDMCQERYEVREKKSSKKVLEIGRAHV